MTALIQGNRLVAFKKRIDMAEKLSDSLLKEWDSKVYADPKYGNEQRMIAEFLKRFGNNTDPLIVAAKISLIDLTNSTQLHRYKSRISLSDLTDIILSIKDFDARVAEGEESLVEEISDATAKNGVNLFSFASKYCHYHNYCIYGRDDYSIYDSVVGKHLYEYSLEQNPINPGTPNKWRKEHDYHKFNSYINDILDANGISGDGRKRRFDHYLWFKYR